MIFPCFDNFDESDEFYLLFEIIIFGAEKRIQTVPYRMLVLRIAIAFPLAMLMSIFKP